MALQALLGGGLFTFLGKAVDKIWPDPEEAARARAALLQAEQAGRLDEMKVQVSAILAEAQSADPWTSRARPSFMYVMYVLILWSIPMGVLSVFQPQAADALIKGMTGYLAAIPEPLYVLFGSGYLGYTVARQWGKAKGSDR